MRTPFPQTRLLPLFLLVLLTLTSPSHASKWYEVHFATIPHPEPVQFFFDFSGQMVIPKLVSPGAYYVFPGMQPRYPGGGIYQNVLDGRSGIWNFASGVMDWVLSDVTPGRGDGFHVYAGETVTFDNKWDHPGDPHTGWTSTITHDSTGTTRRNSWPIGDRFWNQAVFAIEVYGNAWDFGPLEFRNVVIGVSKGKGGHEEMTYHIVETVLDWTGLDRMKGNWDIHRHRLSAFGAVSRRLDERLCRLNGFTSSYNSSANIVTNMPSSPQLFDPELPRLERYIRVRHLVTHTKDITTGVVCGTAGKI
ncbi:hypothetical protein BKA81DRAFT_412039 [Phyllosticta paracitricarpa]